MVEITNKINHKSKQYDLEERTARFAEHCRDFVKELSKTTANFEYGKQLIANFSSIYRIFDSL